MKALRKKDIDYLARLKDGRRSSLLRIALLAALPFALVLGAFAAAFSTTPAPPPPEKGGRAPAGYLQNPQNLQRQSKAVELSDQLAGYTARRDASRATWTPWPATPDSTRSSTGRSSAPHRETPCRWRAPPSPTRPGC